MLYVIIILIALVLFLSVKLILMKGQMKRVIGEMKSNPDKRQMNVDFVDSDLQNMIIEVNHLYEYILQIKAEGKEEESKMRESISMISHDMRTPLTSIIGYLQIAEKTEHLIDLRPPVYRISEIDQPVAGTVKIQFFQQTPAFFIAAMKICDDHHAFTLHEKHLSIPKINI